MILKFKIVGETKMLTTDTTHCKLDISGIHSFDQFSLTVPDLEEAMKFYSAFGLEARTCGTSVRLFTAGSTHCWRVLHEGFRKRLQYVSFGVFPGELSRYRDHLRWLGIELIAPSQRAESEGVWFKDCDGVMVEIKVAEKSSPDEPSTVSHPAPQLGVRTAPLKNEVVTVRPRRLAHVLLFSRDVARSIRFYSAVLGLRLSDEAGGSVAFMHGTHGSDHHMLAFAKANAPGFHHCSWDVSSVDDVGNGAAQMASHGHARGWGMGRHVLGSNYFHYVRDPWGSYAEYSCGMNFIPKNLNWRSASHDAQDGFYLWGPTPPADFVHNFEEPGE